MMKSFSGEIPRELAKMEQIACLELQANQLTGRAVYFLKLAMNLPDDLLSLL
jgi:hypothetical protein